MNKKKKEKCVDLNNAERANLKLLARTVAQDSIMCFIGLLSYFRKIYRVL